jgi:hypothetical protein
MLTEEAALTGPAHLPAWATDLAVLYESDAVNQFLIYGNVEDRFLLPGPPQRLGTLQEFLFEVLLPRFDVLLSYDPGNGIRIERGGPIFSRWPSGANGAELPKRPREAMEFLTHYFRYCANLARMGQEVVQVACVLKDVHLIAPAATGFTDYDTASLVTTIRNWTSEGLLTAHPFAAFLITENVNDVHPAIARNPRARQMQVPLPPLRELEDLLHWMAPRYPAVLPPQSVATIAAALSGSTVAAVEQLMKSRHHTGQSLADADLIGIKKRMVEADCRGLIEFVESRKTLDHLQGHEAAKEWLRQDIALWRKGEQAALPKGYLLCGPVGTGKSYLLECLAGEAGVPVVKLKNFRDRWVGSTEGNLERIFRLIRALGRCYVFIDEADQALGRRNGGDDSGVSGRVYSMLAEEMGHSESRGHVIWVLASSRPDLIEVDFKRPGRVDVKIPLLPAANAREAFELIRFLCAGRDVPISPESFEALAPKMPRLLTPGAAEAVAVKTYRFLRLTPCNPEDALLRALDHYQPAVPEAVVKHQMELAIGEASDPSFVQASYA